MRVGKNKISKKTTFDMWLILISLVILELSGSVTCSVVNENDISKKLSFLLVCLLIPLVARSLSYRINIYRTLISAICVCVYISISMVIYPDSESIQALIIRALWYVLFFSAVLYMNKIQIRFLEYIYKATVIISFFSLFMFVAIEILGIGLPYRTAGNVYTPYHVYFGGFSIYTGHPYNLFGFNIYRLSGIFWEPGIYQIFLNIALYYLFFYCLKRNKIVLVSLVINLFLTFSTTGYCIFVVMATLWVSRNRVFSRYKQIMLIIGAAIAFALVYFILLDKKTGSYSGSYELRVNDLMIGLQLFTEDNLFFGIGYNNTSIFGTAQGLDRGNSNGLITWLYTMGLVGLGVVLFPYIRNMIYESNKTERMNKIVFFGMFILFNMSEPIYFAPIMWLFVAQEYALNVKKKIQHNQVPDNLQTND